MKFRTIWIVLIFSLLLLLPLTLSAGGEKGTMAFAEFSITHPNGCTVTSATVYVYYNERYQLGDPLELQPRVDFTYDIFGQPTDPGCDGLFYNELSGSAPLNSSEFSVASNHKSATLNKTLQVYDAEADAYFDVTISVQWTATGSAPPVATLSLSSPALIPRINPLSPSVSAEIVRLRRG